MSLALKVFTENFLRGMQLGNQMQDRAENRDIKRSTLKYQLAKLEQDAATKRATLAETARRNTAYITQSGAYADYLRKKAGAVGAKGAGAGGPDANVQAFLLDPRVNEPGLATPPPAAPSGGGSSEESMPTPPTPPPADESGGASDDGYRRGGKVRVKRPKGSPRALNTSAAPRFSMGGSTGLGGLMGGGGGSGMGFNPMSYVGDIATIGGEIGNGDQGQTESPQTPYDPMASMWDSVDGHPREQYDEGEQIGSDVGRPVGRAIGDYFTGGVGSGAFAEAGGRFGGGAGAAVQGHFGEAANDLMQGTPLSFIHFQDGGTVPRTALNTSPASRMRYQVRRAQGAARPPSAPSAGTTGPGSGFGEVAAPPVSYMPRYAQGGSVDPVEGMWNSYYADGGPVDNDAPLLQPKATPGMARMRAGGGQASLGATYDPSSRYGAVEAGYEHPVGRNMRVGVQGNIGKDLGPDGASARPDWGVGVRGRIKFADGGNTDMRFPPDNITYDADGNPIWQTDDGPRRPVNPEYGGAKVGGNKFGGNKFGGNKYGGATPGGNTEGGQTYGGETHGGLRHTASAPEPDVPPAYEPGDSGPRQPPEQVMPPVTVTASRDGGGGGAPARRRQLGDQQRSAAYDPEADRMDPRNTGITEPGGGVNERVWRASPEAHPEAYPADNKGMLGERLDRPGPAISTAPPTTVSTAPENYAAKGASRYASNMFKGDQEHALFAGKGAATHPEIADVFKVVDPDNKLPMHEKMIAAQKAAHDYWMAKGDPKQADQAAFEIGQFGNTMARQHGAKAAKAAQTGDQKTAVNELLAGYGWLPDGGTPEVQNNAIVIRDQSGKVTTTIPLQQGTMLNLALGMSTGQLGWDVMHAAAGKQPTSSGPTAQPQAASAGPQPIPAAPQGGAQPPNAGGQGAGEPAPQVAQAPPAPVRPAPPAAPPGAPPAAPPGAPPAAPPGPAPAQMGPEGGGAISTAPPTAPAAPAPPPQVPPTARAAAPAPSPSQPTQGQGQRVPEQKTPEQEQAEQADAEQKHWGRNPYQPVREPNSAEERRDTAIEHARRENIRAEQGIVAAANAHGLAGKGKLPTAVTQAIAAKKKIYEDKVKAANDDYRSDQTERQRSNVPRPIGLNDEKTIASTFDLRGQTLAKAPAGSSQAKFRDDSVLRYAEGEDQDTVKSIASNIWMHNKGLTSQQALDLALTSTSILRPDDKEKDPVGQNRQKGAGATRFRPSNQGDKGLTYLTFGDGTSIKVDNNTYQAIANQHKENWKQWAESQTKAGQQKERDKKNAVTLNTVGSALRTTLPLLPGGAGVGAIMDTIGGARGR